MERHATPEMTARYCERFTERLPRDHFREVLGLRLSSIGLGSYLGDADDGTDRLYEEAVRAVLPLGCNVLDTAINYRFQRSEKSIGRALRSLFDSRQFSRGEIFVSSKAGFIPYDDGTPSDPHEYIEKAFLKEGIIQSDDIVAGCHCIAPKYLEHQLQQSLDNLRLECIDLYFIHNPETQLQQVVRDELNHRVRDAFSTLEKAVALGKIRHYGTATWSGYRSPIGRRDYLSLSELIRFAEEVAGKDHHFRAIQLPLNLAMPEAFSRQNQEMKTEMLSVLDVARGAGMLVMASASICQGSLTGNLPIALKKILGQGTDAQNAIQFVRSTSGVTTALVGMKDRNHVIENMQTAASSPLTDEQYMRLYTGR